MVEERCTVLALLLVLLGCELVVGMERIDEIG